MPAVGRDKAPNKSRFRSCRLPMSGTRSAGMLVAWQAIFIPFSFSFLASWVLAGFSIDAWDEENIPFLLEHSWKQTRATWLIGCNCRVPDEEDNKTSVYEEWVIYLGSGRRGESRGSHGRELERREVGLLDMWRRWEICKS